MTRSAILLVAFVCLVNSCAEVKKTHQLKPSPSAIPTLHITNDTTATAPTISMLDIKTDVAANIAITTFDIRFYNPNDKVLEGEFEFPLADGQQITRYALDMNGSLREGVVVEKAKARVAFENTLRRKIDPGLVEKTKGNNFRTRIYPLPAKGYRRIVIEVEQTIMLQGNDLLYQLPLYADDPIDSFSLKITVIKSSEKPRLDANGVPLQFNKQKENYLASLVENNFIANKTVAFELPGSENDNTILTENHGGQTYFYLNSRIASQYREKNRPASIAVFWDISASGLKRDLKKETSLLKQYLSGLGNVRVSLIPFNVFTEDKEEFVINGNADQLINRIQDLKYDGGTRLGAIDLSRYRFDEILLFTDGLSTFGEQEMKFGSSPVMAITSSPSSDYSYLKYIAHETHGKFINLAEIEPGIALKELTGESLQIINVAYNESEVSEVVRPTTAILNTGLSLAGKLNVPSATIRVELGFGGKVTETKEFRISKSQENDYDQVKRIWAGMKIAELDMEFEKNKEEITKLGKQFSVVTQNTSLLVLDRVEDYVQYEIVPPPELQSEYYSLLKVKKEEEKNQKENVLDDAVAAMDELREWWKKNYTASKRKLTPTIIDADEDGYLGTSVDSTGVTTTAVPFLRLADTSVIADRLSVTYGYHADSSASSSYSVPGDSMTMATGVGAFSSSAEFVVVGTPVKKIADSDSLSSSHKLIPIIELNVWKPEANYIKTLQQANTKDRKSLYDSLKYQYLNQPSFFVDVARFFFEKNEKKQAIVVLSNIAEMKLENAELLRVVANQLMDMDEISLAILTFRDILKMREEDPQSYRDLALAYNESNEYNKAVELLYKLLLGTWDVRFGEVKSIALNEMNAIISAHPGAIKTKDIDKRLIHAMPVDVRIVISWSADNSDIDLWVTDPRNEKCSYEHTETEMGGKISQDVTQGYGPEEFCLRKAWKGNYTIDVNLYGDQRQTLGGPIAIKADLFTDFGKPTQKRKTINLRVTTNKEVVNLGSLKFGS